MAMAVGSGGARISSCMTLKEVQKRLASAAQCLSSIIKSVLDLWLVLEDDLPKYLQHPPTVAAMRLVQAAVLQAPSLIIDEEQYDEARMLAWLQKHLPGISTAMQQSASSQLEIISRRVSILQSLAHSPVQTDCAQPSARVQNEQYTFMMVQAMADIFLTVAPVATLCEFLPRSNNARTRHRPHHEQGHQKQRLQQGKELMLLFTRSLVLCEQEARAPVAEQLCNVNDSWGQQGVLLAETLAEGPAELQTRIARLNYGICMAAVTWLDMMSHLPPNSHTNAIMLVIDWDLLATAPMSDPLRDLGRRAFHNLLTRPNAVKDLHRCVPPACMPKLLHAFMVTADDLQSLGVLAAHVQLLLPGSQETEPGVPWGQSSASRGSKQRQQQEGSSGSSGTASAGSSRGEASDECDDHDHEVDDMQALLRMMYGTTV